MQLAEGKTAVALLLCLGWFLAAWLATGYAIDDTYIHLTYADNLASGRGLRFASDGEPLYSCTSPAWVGALAAFGAAGAPGPGAARMLSCLAGAATLLLVWRLAGRMLGRQAAPYAALLLAVNPWWVRWSCSGMETSAAGLLVAACLLLQTGGRPGFAALLSGFGVMVRPELLVLGPILVAAGGGPLRRRLPRLLLWLLPSAAWLGFAAAYFGSPLPVSAMSKVAQTSLPAYLGQSLARLAGVLALGDALPLAALALLALGWLLGPWRRRPPGPGWAPLLVLPPALAAVIMAGRGPMVSRYLMPAWPAVVVVEVAGMRELARRVGGRLLRGWRLAPLLAAAISAVVLAHVFVPHMSDMDRNLEVYADAARYMRDSLPGDARVAVHEVGVFGYIGERRLIDLEGLVTPEAADYPGLDRDLAGSVRMLRELGATHLMDPNDRARLLDPAAAHRLGVSLRPLAAWEFPRGTSMSGRGYRRVLYRLEWQPAAGRPTGAR